MAKQNNVDLSGRTIFKWANAFYLPFEDNKFEVCFSQGFLEHFDDDDIRKLVKEQLRVSRVIIFSVPSFWYPKQDFGDERLMKKEGWLEILAEFKVDKAIYYSGKWRSDTSSVPAEVEPSQIYFKVTK